MSDDTHDCGHTEEEHLQQMQEAVLDGDMTPIFAMLPPDMLIHNIKMIVNELFVRSQDDEEFERALELLNGLIHRILLNGEEEPETRENLLKARASYTGMVEGQQFQAEAEDELRIMLEQHGVLDDTPQAAIQDEQYGFYL